jgi:glycine C-acetyltransferase
MALIDKLQKREQGIAAFADNYGYFVYPELTGPISNRMFFRGREVIVWSLNDYLGLSADEEIVDLEGQLVAKYGMSYPGGSRLLSGNTEYHELLEKQLAQIIGKECMLLNLVYVGSISILHALMDRSDIAIYDQRIHASLVDGLKGHVGKKLSFKHNNVEHLKTQLKRVYETKDHDSEVFVVVDGIYSMSGGMAPIAEITQLKEHFPFTLIVDDSHGFLIYDEGGAPQHQGVMDKVDIYISSFGKALGNVGGFVAANSDIISYFKYNLRSQIFGRSLSIVHVISVSEKLRILESDTSRRSRLWRSTQQLQTGLTKIGIDIGLTRSPITPIMLRCPVDVARDVVINLRDHFGVFCSGVVFPVIPKGQILLRLVATASHTEQDVGETLHAFSRIEKYVADKASRSPTAIQL